MPRPKEGDRVKGPWELADGRWRVIVAGPRVEARTGRRRIIATFPAAQKEAAQNKATEWEQLIERAKTIGARKALDLYADHLRAQGLKDRSVYDYTSRLWPLIAGAKLLTWHDLRPEHVGAWLAGQYGEGEVLSRPTQVGHLRKLRAFLAWACPQGYAIGDPSTGIAPGGRRARGKTRLTEAELRLLDGACGDDSSEGALAVHLLLWTGARPQEVLSMRVRDLVLGERPARWAIPWDPDGPDGTKTEAGEGAVELPDVLATRLAVHSHGRALDAYVFVAGRRAQGHRGLSWIGDHVRRKCRDAKIRSCEPYALRGSLAGLLRRRGFPLASVSAALGHAGTDVTADHYVGRRVDQAAALEEARARLRGAGVSGPVSDPIRYSCPEGRDQGGPPVS